MFVQLFRNKRYMQYVCVSVATMTISSVSMYGSWPSPTLPILQSSISPLDAPITDLEGSWIVSSITIATPISCIFVTWQIGKLGRKGALILSSVLMLVPWIIIIFARTPMEICLARLLGGFGFGCAYTATAMYSGEIADADIRGKLGVITSIMKQLGTLLVLSIGPFISFVQLALICLGAPALFLVLIMFMPESPYHLLLQGNPEQARKVLVRLADASASSEYIERKLVEIQDIIDSDMQSRGTLWELLWNKEYRQVLMISLGLKSLTQFSGVIAIDSYMQQIIEDTGSSLSPQYSSLIFGIVQLPATFLAIVLVDKIGRKPLLIVSAIGSAIALSAESIYFYLQHYSYPDMASIHWLPTTGIVLFLIMSNIGITSIPTVILSEIFPTNIKSIAIAVNTMYGSLMSFLVAKFFKPSCNLIGIHMTFLIFTACCLLGALFIVFYMPETKGKTFPEIQTKLNRNYKKKLARKQLNLQLPKYIEHNNNVV